MGTAGILPGGSIRRFGPPVGWTSVIGYHPPMLHSTDKTSKKSLLLAAILGVTILASGCASDGSRDTASTAPPATTSDARAWVSIPGNATLFGIAGDHFVSIDPRSGVATSLATSAEIWQAGALTYDPKSRTFYAIADPDGNPRLIAIDRDSGTIRSVGTIDLPNLDLDLVEGLAFDTTDGVLYATGDRSTFASQRLLKIDPASGAARMVGRIRNTSQNDVDALVAIAGKLYGLDVVGYTSTLYEIDKTNGSASQQPRRFERAVSDLTFDPATRRLLAPVENARSIAAMALNGQVAELGPTHAESGLGGWPISAITSTATATAKDLFGDNFESGDLTLWEAGGASR